MKKFLLVFILADILIIGGLITYLILNANTLISQYKPQIEKAVSQALGTQLTLGNLDFNVGLQPTIKIDQVRVGGNADAFSLRDLYLSVDLTALLSKKLVVSELGLTKPELIIVKTAGGIQIAGLPQKEKKASPSPQEPAPHTSPANSNDTASSDAQTTGFNLALEKFIVQEARILIKDETQGTQLEIFPIDVSSQLSLSSTGVFLRDFKVSAHTMEVIDLGISIPEIEFDPRNARVVVKNGKASFPSGSLNFECDLTTSQQKGTLSLGSTDGIDLSKLETFKGIVPAIAQFKLAGTVRPDFHLTLASAEKFSLTGQVSVTQVSAQIGEIAINNSNGVLNLSGNENLQKLSIKDFVTSLNGSSVHTTVSVEKKGDLVTMTDLMIQAFGGGVSGTASLDLATQPFSYQSSVTTTGLSIESALAALKPSAPQILTGTVQRFQSSVRGSLGPDLLQKVEGTAVVDVRSATIKGFNLAGSVLQAVKGIPMMSGSLMQSAPKSATAELNAEDTQISSLTGTIAIGSGALRTNDLKALSGLFSLDARGAVGFNGSLDLDSTITFSQSLSSGLVASTREVARILDSKGQLSIPLRITGVAPSITVLPNVQKLIEAAAKNALKDQAGKALDRALGAKGAGKGLSDLLGF